MPEHGRHLSRVPHTSTKMSVRTASSWNRRGDCFGKTFRWPHGVPTPTVWLIRPPGLTGAAHRRMQASPWAQELSELTEHFDGLVRGEVNERRGRPDPVNEAGRQEVSQLTDVVQDGRACAFAMAANTGFSSTPRATCPSDVERAKS